MPAFGLIYNGIRSEPSAAYMQTQKILLQREYEEYIR